MFHRSRIIQGSASLVLTMLFILGSFVPFAPLGVSTVYAETNITADTEIVLRLTGPSYVQADETLSYELTVQNLSGTAFTGLVLFDNVPTNAIYESGGHHNIAENRVEFTLPSLAAHAKHTFSWVARAKSDLAVGNYVVNDVFRLLQSNPAAGYGWYGPVNTLVEAPGALFAIYKNTSGIPFDVNTHGFQFENYGNEGIPNPNDDLGAQDVFELFGPGVCQSGNTAATCKLSGPAQAWLTEALKSTAGGHCDGMAATSLRFFNSMPFRQYSTPATFQAGAASTINLNFPAQPIENYITRYFHTQSYIWNTHFVGTPAETIDHLIAEFNKTPSVAYSVAFFLARNLDRLDQSTWKNGHAVVAYGVEFVTDDEARILVYDNNFPKQRKYFTVNLATNTWRYVTASTPGQPEDAYEGTAFSFNLRLVPLAARDLPAGQYFECPFCPNQNLSSAQLGESDTISGELDFRYTGEGSILVVNDAGQKTGDDLTGNFVNQIPNAQLFPFQGGLGKEIPPMIGIPVAEIDETYYSVVVHGKSVVTPTMGTLGIHGPGFSMGVNDIHLDAGEVFSFTISPDGDHISFTATEAITVPELYISHDPVHPSDPSVIFDVEGITLLAGEKISLDLDPVLERIYFDHTGPEAENLIIDMKHIWPDGDEQDYAETIQLPAGATSAFIDFGAWDGLLSPPLYIDHVLQNSSINHRLKLSSLTQTYEPTPQANAPQGVYHINATFTNVTEITLETLSFTVANVVGGNVVLNADGGPGGLAAKISVPATALGGDGFLEPNESFAFSFDVGLAAAALSDLTVNANGVSVDWMLTTPAPAGDAQNASFAFIIGANIQRVYLPMISR